MKKGNKTRDIVICGLFAALIGILAQISIPMPAGVPLTMQTLAVSLAGVILGSKKGFVATAIYVLMGAIGLPVFAGFSGGFGIVMGATGGFIISFPLMAFIIGLISERVKENKSVKGQVIIFIGMMIGAIINYAIGMGQFMIVTNSSLLQAFTACVAPFIITGVLKGAIATVMGITIKNHRGLKGIISYDNA
ncbi:MAG: biotin transporter BioY [Clostridium sp.]